MHTKLSTLPSVTAEMSLQQQKAGSHSLRSPLHHHMLLCARFCSRMLAHMPLLLPIAQLLKLQAVASAVLHDILAYY